jgi:O-methyltransferase
MNKLTKLITNPGKYLQLAFNLIQQKTTYFHHNKAFFKQGQMDIHPKSRWHIPEFKEQTGGFFPIDNQITRVIHNLEPWDNTRRDMITLLLRTIISKNIPGDFAEIGVYKGSTAKLIHHYAPERALHLFDTFSGFGERNVTQEKAISGIEVSQKLFSDSSLEIVQENIKAQNDLVNYYKGYFPETIPENFNKKTFAFVHLDADLYDPIIGGLNFFYPRMSKGGMILVHDYNAWPGARKAVEEFFVDKNEIPIPMPDKSGSALIVKN